MRPKGRKDTGHLERGLGSVFTRTGPNGKARIVCEATVGGQRRTLYRDEHDRPFPDERAGRDFLRRLHARIEAGRLADPSKQPLGEHLDEWLAEIVRPHRKVTTYPVYEGRLRRHVPEDLRKLPLSRIDAPRLQRWVNTLSETLAPATVRSTAGALQTALSQAVKWGKIDANPFRHVELPKVPRAEPAFWAPADARRFLLACRPGPHGGQSYWGAALATCVYLGLRRGEVLGLTWPDVDLEAGTVTVRGNLQRVPAKALGLEGKAGKLLRLPPKSERGRRTHAIPKALGALLALHRAAQGRERALWGDDWERNEKESGIAGLVFPRPGGLPANPQTLGRAFEKLRKEAGLTELTLHGLRHSYGTALLSAGEDPRTVMELMGHADLRQTTHYLHALEERKIQAAARIDLLFGENGTEKRGAAEG